MGPRLEVEVAAASRARRWIDLDGIGDGVVLSSSSSAVCRGVDQAVHVGGYGYPPWLYFEIRHQKWFTVEAVAVLRQTSLPSLPQFVFQLTRSLKFVLSDYPVGQISRPDYPATIFSDIFLLSSNFIKKLRNQFTQSPTCLLYTSPSPRD